MDKKTRKNVYQFKITLKNIKPPVWRRIQVPEDYSFWDLHAAIQDSMGWSDYHLHEFETISNELNLAKKVGIPDFDSMDSDILPGWKEDIKDWFSLEKNRAMNYTYDFGDNWGHRIELEKIIHRDDKVSCPVCIDGKRACPPEDSGGVWGYEDKLNIIKNPKHPEYDEIVEWMGEYFNSEEFDCADVIFNNPAKSLKNSGLLEQFAEKLKNTEIIKKEENKTKPTMDWEIDYSELSYQLKNERGEIVKPLIMIIVHPESYFVLSTHLTSPNGDYLQEFSDKILTAINEKPFLPERILVKKKELFDFLQKTLKKTGIKLELVKRTKAVEVIKKDMGKFFNQ